MGRGRERRRDKEGRKKEGREGGRQESHKGGKKREEGGGIISHPTFPALAQMGRLW